MTFAGYGSVRSGCLRVFAGGTQGVAVERAQSFIAPGIVSWFAITCSSQSKAALTCTWCAPWLRGCQFGRYLQPRRASFPRLHIYSPWCVWAGVRHEQPSESAADANHAWRGHLMWKARVNKIPTGRKMHNHCLGTGASHHEMHANLSRLLLRLFTEAELTSSPG